MVYYNHERPKLVTVEKPAYQPWGRYVCDSCNANRDPSELHLFDSLKAAMKFSKAWDRSNNVGWLSPTYDRKTGRNRQPTAVEAKKQVSKSVTVHDHRKNPT